MALGHIADKASHWDCIGVNLCFLYLMFGFMKLDIFVFGIEMFIIIISSL